MAGHGSTSGNCASWRRRRRETWDKETEGPDCSGGGRKLATVVAILFTEEDDDGDRRGTGTEGLTSEAREDDDEGDGAQRRRSLTSKANEPESLQSDVSSNPR